MHIKVYIYPILFVAILVQVRLIPHSPNFTPILAASIFSGSYFRDFLSIYPSHLGVLWQSRKLSPRIVVHQTKGVGLLDLI